MTWSMEIINECKTGKIQTYTATATKSSQTNATQNKETQTNDEKEKKQSNCFLELTD